MKVLIVEDNLMNRQLAGYLLRKAGIETAEVESGEDALAWLAENTVDLILLDIQLPEMDGIEVLRRIRLNENWRDATVIALTAYSMQGDKERFEAVGFDGYIAKPIDSKAFVQTILQGNYHH
jgi:CheY-like chemotaxis protein